MYPTYNTVADFISLLLCYRLQIIYIFMEHQRSINVFGHVTRLVLHTDRYKQNQIDKLKLPCSRPKPWKCIEINWTMTETMKRTTWLLMTPVIDRIIFVCTRFIFLSPLTQRSLMEAKKNNIQSIDSVLTSVDRLTNIKTPLWIHNASAKLIQC